MAHLKGRDRASYVASMFARIARRYDLMNTLMTAGQHHAWRRLASDMAVGDASGPALDVATGTGDFALDLAGRPQVTEVLGLDFTPDMLPLARRKTRDKGLENRVHYLLSDAHALPLADDRFVCVTVGFGVRNFIDVPQAMKEMVRVVRRGGRVVVLEIVRIEGSGPIGLVLPIYFRYVTPWLGAIFAGDREAYTYLPESVQGFLSASELASLMKDAGLHISAVRMLALGSVAVIVGEKGGKR